MTSTLWRATRMGALLVPLVAAHVSSQDSSVAQSGGPAIYTEEQAKRGGATYASMCSSCHGADLRGLNDAPPLIGREFLNAWGRQRVSDLLGFVAQSMPPTGPGSLAPDVALDILAYMLQSNGARAGAQALTATTSTRIEAVAGQVQPQESAR